MPIRNPDQATLCRFLVTTVLVLPALSAHAAGVAPGTRYLHADHLGSTVAWSDSTGEVVQRAVYRPWGTPRRTPAIAGDEQAARYTGKEWEAATGLFNFDARHQDPSLGRFTGPDAARQTRSPYVYAGASPLENVDPSGNVYGPAVEELIENAAKRHGIVLATAKERLHAGYMALEELQRLQLHARTKALQARRALTRHQHWMLKPHRRIARAARRELKYMKKTGPGQYSLDDAPLADNAKVMIGPQPGDKKLSRFLRLRAADLSGAEKVNRNWESRKALLREIRREYGSVAILDRIREANNPGMLSLSYQQLWELSDEFQEKKNYYRYLRGDLADRVHEYIRTQDFQVTWERWAVTPDTGVAE